MTNSTPEQQDKAAAGSLPKEPELGVAGDEAAEAPAQAGARGLGSRLVRDASVKEALFAFCLTRIPLLVIFVLVGHLSFEGDGTGLGKLIQDPIIYLGTQSQSLPEILVRGDSNRYITIAREGYEHQPFSTDQQYNWAFFPLQALLLRAVGSITGEYAVSGALASNVLFFLVLVLLHKTTLEFGFDGPTAGRAVLYLAIFPVSYFFSLPLSESLFLALTIGAFYAAQRQRWLAASLLGALASAARVTGILLLPVFLLLYWQRYEKWSRRDWLYLLLIPSGLISFMIYLRAITGNPLAFLDIQVAFGRESDYFLSPLVNYLSSWDTLAIPWDFRILNFAAALMTFGCVYVLLKRRQFALGSYCFLSIAPPLFNTTLISFSRYAMVAFPVFIALGLKGRSQWVDQIIRFLFILLFGIMATLFAAHFSIALA